MGLESIYLLDAFFFETSAGLLSQATMSLYQQPPPSSVSRSKVGCGIRLWGGNDQQCGMLSSLPTELIGGSVVSPGVNNNDKVGFHSKAQQ